MYTVKKGDTLWKIAEMHYGKGQGAKHTEIVKANSPPVKNPGHDPAGMGLAHPSVGISWAKVRSGRATRLVISLSSSCRSHGHLVGRAHRVT